MLRRNESLEQMQERLDREHDKFLKYLRRCRWSLIGFLTVWAFYILALPFTTSPEQMIYLLSLFLIAAGQYFYVIEMN